MIAATEDLITTERVVCADECGMAGRIIRMFHVPARMADWLSCLLMSIRKHVGVTILQPGFHTFDCVKSKWMLRFPTFYIFLMGETLILQ